MCHCICAECTAIWATNHLADRRLGNSRVRIKVSLVPGLGLVLGLVGLDLGLELGLEAQTSVTQMVFSPK